MKFKNKNILLISPEPWEHLFVSKHHYATHLGEMGNRIFFLGPPVEKYNIEETDFVNVWKISYKGFIRGLRFFPSLVQRMLIRKEFNKIQFLAKCQIDIVWSFDNSVFYDFKALPNNVLSISHIVDLNQNFQTAKAASSANLCIGVIQEIVLRLKRYNQNSFLIPHGVMELKKELSKTKLPGLNKFKAMYSGNMSMPHIDWSLINELVEKCSYVDFIFIGDNLDSVNKSLDVNNFNNVYTISRVNPTELRSYLASADILLLAYTNEYYKTFASPHKILEYFASGRVIIASWTDEYEELLDDLLMKMEKDRECYINSFKMIVENIEFYNSTQLLNQRIDFSKRFSYKIQIEKIEKIASEL